MPVVRTPIESEAQWKALRAPNIGASEVAATMGCHDYLTVFELWARKTGKIPPPLETDAMRRGRLLEPVAVQMIAEEFPQWKVERPGAYFCDPVLRLGATPDLFATDPKHGPGVIQIKTVEPSVFRRAWYQADELRPPTWIAVQTITETMLTDCRWAAVAALVVGYGIDLHMVDVPFHEGVADRVRSEAAHFWHLVETGRQPDPDYGRDGALLRTLLARDDGTEIDLSGDNELGEILDRREQAQAQVKFHTEAVKTADAMLLHKLGTAAVGRFADGYVSAKTINRRAYEVKATSYRQIRVVRQEHAA